MEEVFAGFIVGWALAFVMTPLAAIQLVRSNDRTGFAQRVAPPGTNILALSMVIHVAALLALTMVGLLFGVALGGLEDRRPDGGLGSPNLVYTLLVLAVTAVVFIPGLLFPLVRRYVIIAAVLFAVAFGWGLPWLAVAAQQ